jgi:hypothetical protein
MHSLIEVPSGLEGVIAFHTAIAGSVNGAGPDA